MVMISRLPKSKESAKKEKGSVSTQYLQALIDECDRIVVFALDSRKQGENEKIRFKITIKLQETKQCISFEN